mgnify:CR=1 FL=1
MRAARTDVPARCRAERRTKRRRCEELQPGGGAPEAAASTRAAFGERSDPAERTDKRREKCSRLFATVRSDG